MLKALLETSSRKVLATDPNTLAKLEKLTGKVIALNLQKINQIIYIPIHEDALTIEFAKPDNIDVSLIAKPSTLLKIAHQGIEEASLSDGELVIEGDAIVGQRFASLLNELDIDWEELFSELIGDVPARTLFSFLEQAKTWHSQSSQVMKQNVGNYLNEESGLFAHRYELNEFGENVTNLNNTISQLENRLTALSKKLS